MRLKFLTVVAAAAAAAATPALAQKSQDTLRIAINNPFAVLSTYDLPVDESGIFNRDVYDYLIYYDEHEQKIVPGLAKSITRIDHQTLELELRDDIKFHNGDKFDADDVKMTVDYAIDPKAKITYPANYNWVKEIEKLGPYKIRIHSVEPIATDMQLLAYRFPIYDSKVMGKLPEKQDYGRLSPIGTGIYKVVKLDSSTGIAVERYDAYNTTPKYKNASIKRIQGVWMPDRQTQAAQMMVGGVDLLRNIEQELAKSLSANPDVKVTYVPEMNLMYMALDSMNLSGNKALSDPRVRQAIHMGVDREELIKYVIPGGEVAEHINADCFKAVAGCKYTTKPPAYDPEGAKKLLAEAGYPNGLDVNYVVYAPNKSIGEAIAGQLLKIGVRMTVQADDIALYRRLQGEGKLQAWSILFPIGSYPDAGNVFNVLFTGPAAKYYNDDKLQDLMKQGLQEFDPAKRAEIYAQAFDRVNTMHYHLPISSVPTVYVHSKDVEVKSDPFSAGQTYITDYAWK